MVNKRTIASGVSHERGRCSRWIVLGWVIVMLALVGCGGPPSTVTGQVHLEDGTIQGRQYEDGLHVFSGVPYAAPPVGDLRWQPPQPVMPWSGVRNAVDPGPACMQPRSVSEFYDEGITYQSEDCLTLNVWTRARKTQEKLPVMVWIHGGALNTGSGDLYPGFELTSRGVILVTINYRLGVFGFFAHPELTAEGAGRSGNQGFFDQIQALRWVQDNIERFGGDPSNVTVFGESAGSWSVSVLQASPLAQGLFQKAIGQSGARLHLMPYLDRDVPALPSAHTRGHLAASVMASQEAPTLSDLRALSAETIIERVASSVPVMMDMDGRTVVDGVLLPKQPGEIFAAGEQQDVPVMIGSNANEFATLLDVFVQGRDEDRTETLLAEQFDLMFPGQGTQLSQVFHSSDVDPWDRAPLAAYMADVMFTEPMRTWADSMGKVSSPAYVYWWSNPSRIVGYGELGAFHAAEIPYVFGRFDSFAGLAFEVTDRDRQLSRIALDLWTNFAKNGVPAAGGLPTWPGYTIAEPIMMELRSDPQVVTDVRGDRIRALQAANEARAKAAKLGSR